MQESLVKAKTLLLRASSLLQAFLSHGASREGPQEITFVEKE